MSNEIVTTTKPNTDLDFYGRRSDVLELSERIKKMLPGGQKYNSEEALTLAQMAVAHELDPFNGEIWLIKGNDGKVYGALVGIKGFRKHAKMQANYWGVNGDGGFARVITPEKLEEYGAQPGDIVYEYRITDEVIIEGWSKAVSVLMKAGLTFEQAQKAAGPMPYTIGIGVWKKGEQTKMRPQQCAMYRAEKDALKRRFDVQFRIGAPRIADNEIHAIAEDYDAIEADYVEPETNGDEPVDRLEEAELIAQLGFEV